MGGVARRWYYGMLAVKLKGPFARWWRTRDGMFGERKGGSGMRG